MADEENDQVAETLAAPSSGGGKNPLATLLLAVNALLMGSIAYFQFQEFENDKKREDIRDVIKAEHLSLVEEGETVEGVVKAVESGGDLMQLEPFTANLAQGDGPKRFIRMTTVLKFSKDSNQEEFKARTAQIRDSIISLLNSKRPEDLLKVEGKSYLKEEIKSAINSFFVDGNVTNIFYTSFQIN